MVTCSGGPRRCAVSDSPTSEYERLDEAYDDNDDELLALELFDLLD